MRLTCPNCGAQYEVDESVIPENGRDVQCSNCGHTWFQRHASDTGADDEAGAEPAASGTDAGSVDRADEREAAEAPDVAGAAAATADREETATAETDEMPAPEADAEPGQMPETAAQTETEVPPAAEPRRPLDEGVTDILREEAARETAARERDGAGLETQPDLGLSEPAGDADAERQARMARLRGLEDDHGAATAAMVTGTRRELLPDIEELNSTLTASADDQAEPDGATATERRRSGFRRGFIAAVVIFALMALAYVYSPLIADNIPGSEGVMSAYVDWVNGLRNSVDAMMQRAVDRLTALVSQIGGTEGSA